MIKKLFFPKDYIDQACSSHLLSGFASESVFSKLGQIVKRQKFYPAADNFVLQSFKKIKKLKGILHILTLPSGELPQSLVPRVLGKTPQVNEDHNLLHF